MPKLPPNPSLQIAPSILSADFARLADHIASVAPLVKMLHLDIMDGHFVPNLTIGPPVLKKIRPHFPDLFFDTHLMITDPEKYAPEFVKAGADGITFHIETTNDPFRMIRLLRDLDVNVGVCLKPNTPVDALVHVLPLVDMVLLMTVEPGFGGQAFLPQSPQRAQQLRALLRPDQRLEVDGGIDPTTTPLITAAGADTLVAGSAIFAQPDPPAALQAIQHAAHSPQ